MALCMPVDVPLLTLPADVPVVIKDGKCSSFRQVGLPHHRGQDCKGLELSLDSHDEPPRWGFWSLGNQLLSFRTW